MDTRTAALSMLEELESGYPETCKVPGREGGYIRVPLSVNCEWYRRFCRQFMRSRRRYPKFRTIIKRCHTIAALRRIASENEDGVYAERLRPFIEERVSEAEVA